MYARFRGRARLVRDFEELVSECGPLLDCVFEAAPRITALGVSRVLKRFNFDISDRPPPLFVEDYVAVRRAGLRLDAPLCELPSREIAKCLADRHLYGVSSVVDLQRCAFERGAVIARSAFRRFCERSFSVRVISCWKDMGDEQDLRWMLERLLSQHLVSDGVHRVCEELLGLKSVCLPFEVLRSRLLRGRLCRGPGKNLGRRDAESCWRVMLAYVERARVSFGDSPLLDFGGFGRLNTSVWYDR